MAFYLKLNHSLHMSIWCSITCQGVLCVNGKKMASAFNGRLQFINTDSLETTEITALLLHSKIREL